jgi:hypothetical protein
MALAYRCGDCGYVSRRPSTMCACGAMAYEEHSIRDFLGSFAVIDAQDTTPPPVRARTTSGSFEEALENMRRIQMQNFRRPMTNSSISYASSTGD